MVTKREKQLATILLKERIESMTGKKVVLKEENNIRNTERRGFYGLLFDAIKKYKGKLATEEMVEELENAINNIVG